MVFWKKKPVIGSPVVQKQAPEGTGKFNEVKRAYEACLSFGGIPIMGFGQGQRFIRDVWRTFYQGTGICQALVNYWLIDHAAGSSLWNRLFNQHGVFIPGAIQVIAEQQGEFGKPDDIGTNSKLLQKIRSDSFLKTNGLIRRSGIVDGTPLLHSGGSKLDSDTGTARGERIGRAIAYEGMANAPSGCYRMISFTSDTVSHVVCAWVQIDIAFFDPNYGEFYFDNKRKFVEWFAKFWHTDTYNNFAGYEIRDFAHNPFNTARRG